MAVRAHEDALLGLLPKLGQALAGRHAQRERLSSRIHMVEVEVDHAPVIAADGAAAARLGHKNPLDLLEAARNGLADAALAPPTGSSLPGAIAMKDHQAMTAALPQLGRATRLRRSSLLTYQRPRRPRVHIDRWHERMFVDAPDGRPP
jgi:hypothetical protein